MSERGDVGDMAIGKIAIRTLIRASTLAALLAGAGIAPMSPATAADPAQVPAHAPVIQVAASEATSRFIPLGIGKSVAIDLPADIKDVLVANPLIANAVIRSARRVYMIGVAVGQTNIFFFDANGKQIAGFDIAVTRDLNGLRAVLKQAMPETNISIEGLGDGVILSGSASSAAESQQAYDLASRLVGDSSKVVNSVVVRGRDQVMLKVTIAEVQRQIIKQLGINLSGSAGLGSAVVNFNTNNPFPVNGTPSSTIGGTFKSVTANMQAMEQAGVIRVLAEPTLTAISGETANFLAGGSFPYPIPATAGSPPGIQFQTFGVSLVFTPVVLSAGRISLKVMTEASELSPQNSVTVSGITVPGLTVRRAETTVEISSGGSLAMAGMLQEETKQTISGLPGLMQLPVLGTLFKSRDYLNSQTELMVVVTPYIVRAVARKELSQPDDGFADPNDPSTVFLGQLNRKYGSGGQPQTEQPASSSGKYGFILD